jgi:ectoine hydroxylase-related dioxygenase (phytanoyl-CoA dioxygenase family)
MNTTENSVLNTYQEQGYLSPVDIISADQATTLLNDLEAAEIELADDDDKRALLHAYPDRLLPSFDALIRQPALIASVSQILGPDLMVWSAGLFDKAANSGKIVSWHQDLTYWGLDNVDELTAWVALSPTTLASGCMLFIPGSHKQQLVPHVDTFAENNLLTRGQQVDVEVNKNDGVAIELQPGQASMHHGHLFHSSGPNKTQRRRIGAAIRFIKPSMRQQSGDRTLVAHVSGEDRYNHFRVAATPRQRLAEDDFERCREDVAIKRRVLYAGAEDSVGTRY